MTIFPSFVFADGERDVRQTQSNKVFRSQLSNNIFADYVSNTDASVQARQLKQSKEDFTDEYYDNLSGYINDFGPSEDVSPEVLKKRADDYRYNVGTEYCGSIPEYINIAPSVQEPMPTLSTQVDTVFPIAFGIVIVGNRCGPNPQVEVKAQTNGTVAVDLTFQGNSGAFIFTPSPGFSGMGGFEFKLTNADPGTRDYGIVNIQIG